MKNTVPGPPGSRAVAVLPLESPDATTVLRVADAGVSLEALERALIAFALARTGGNRTRAARLLGLTRSALIYRMRKHGLDNVASPADDAKPREIL